MVETICNECQTQNPAANAFCTACGHKLARIEIQVLDVGDSLQQGYKLVTEHKLDQAMAIACAVLKKSPEESGAYALMAMVHEERGDVPEAIRCYEEVVRLRPESQIDAIKLAQLRAMTEPSGEAATPSKRGLAVVVAVSAGLMAIAVGMAFAWPRAEDSPKGDDQSLLASSGARGFDVPETIQNAAQTQTNPAADQQEDNQIAGEQPVTRANRAVLPPAANGSSTPRTLPKSSSLPPLVVDVTPEDLAKMSAPKATQPPAPARPGDDNVIERNPGQIKISESRKAPASDPGVSENTYRVAQNKMKAGDYRGAISDFQAALGGSGKKAMIHQLIGRCYTRLGDKGAAKQHFESALSMYEAAGAKSAADSVRRELGLLG